MCGMMGIMTGAREFFADDFIKDSFTTSMLRGVDSSGIAMIDPDTQRSLVHKLPIAGNFFVEDKVAAEIITAAGAARSLTMCHVRAATVGKVTVSNAHPFEINTGDKTLIGTHNGTLRNWQTKTNGSKFTVDSEWALSRIAVEGIDAFEEITGAFAFAWWDSSDPTFLNFARNDERPLAVAFIEGNGLAYASEAGMLYWLLERNKINLDGPILELSKDKYYKFEVNNPKNFTSYNLPAPIVSNSYSHSTGTYNYNHSYNYTVVDKVDALVNELTGSTNLPVPLTKEEQSDYALNFPLVFEKEKQMALEYGWLDVEVDFYPVEVTRGGNTQGIADVIDGNYSYDAFIRGDMSTFPMEHTWKCKIIGLQDDDRDMVFILSKPHRTIKEQKQEA